MKKQMKYRIRNTKSLDRSKFVGNQGVGKKKDMKMNIYTVDHVVPKALGGSEDDSNRELLCREHHDEKERGGSEDGSWKII